MTDTLDTNAAKADILGKVKHALGVEEADQAARLKAITTRIAKHKRGVIPNRGSAAAAERLNYFMEQIIALSGTAEHVGSAEDVPKAIATYLKQYNLPAEIRAGADKRLKEFDWAKAPTLKVTHGPARDDDKVCLTYAVSGVAETGTLVLTSGEDNPTSLNFMPDHSIVVVDGQAIDACYEDGFDRVRKNNKTATLPRSINFITGPSRTADIEQVIYFGAHGPKHLHVIVVG